MDGLREEYKTIIMRAARMAVKGGAMSEAFEEFIIDSVDGTVDELSDSDFDYLLDKRKVPIREIDDESKYAIVFQKLQRAKQLLSSGQLLPNEAEQITDYCRVLQELNEEYKESEWG